MADLREVPSLLPINATDAETAMEAATARVELVPRPVRDMKDAAAIQANMLPWLAWEFCVPNWSPGWTEEQRRRTVLTSLAVLKKRGTPDAVNRAIGALFTGSRMLEWHKQAVAGAPYTFELLLTVTTDPLERELLLKIIEVVENTKNLRSWLTAIRVSIRTEAPLHVAGALGLGVEFELGRDTSTPLPLKLDGSWKLDGAQTLDGVKN